MQMRRNSCYLHTLVSVQDLANTMSLGVSYVWVRTADGQEVKMPVNQVQRGDVIVVRTSAMIPLDGKVIFGNAMVNQASMTGESVPVHKTSGSYVYAGTVVEEGECSICVVNTAGEGRYEKTAKLVAEQIGVDNYFAEVLPEDKAEFIRKEQEIGHKVIMVGDGINDSPALSEASVGIAISTGATIACEIADITISTESLYALVELKQLSNALMKRITKNYYSIIWGNGLLIGLGVVGWISPSLSALLHNLSTLALGLNSMTDLE